jgi:hypothetical protein
LILSFNLIAVDREVDYRTANMAAGLSKRSELDIKDYEIAILAAIVIDGDPADSAGTDLEIDVVKVLMVFIFIRSVDIY